MEFDFVYLLEKVALPTALLAYYVWKDWNLTDRQLTLMGRTTDVLDRVEEHLDALEKKGGA